MADGDTITIVLLQPVVGLGRKNAVLTVVQNAEIDALFALGYAKLYSTPDPPPVAPIFLTTAAQDLSDGQQAQARTNIGADTGSGGGALLTPTAVKTAAYAAAAGDLVPVDTTSAAVTVTLPSAPADKTQVAVKHVIQGGSNSVTIACGASDVLNKTGGSTSLTLPTLFQAVVVQYKASGGIWYVIDDSVTLTAINTLVTARALASDLATETTRATTAEGALSTRIDGKQAAGSYATAAQGAKADTATQPADLAAAVAGLDDVLGFANLAAFPATGTTNTVYEAFDTNFLYRWSGSAYVQVGGGAQTDATTGTKGVVQLAGDLGGTAALPRVLKLNNVAVGTAATKNVGTATGTVAAGDDPRIVGAAPAASHLEGAVLSIYGTSLDVTPGLRCTTGLEWFAKLKTRLGLSAVNTYAMSARNSLQASFFMVGASAGASGVPAFPAGSTWPTTRRGLAAFDTYGNDVANILDLSVSPFVPNTLSTADQARLKHSLQAMCSVASSSRLEIETGTLTGTWNALTDASYSGGGARYTTTAGDTCTMPVTIPAVGYVDFLINALDPALATPAAIIPTLDGVAQTTIAASTLTIRAVKEGSGANLTSVPGIVRVTGTPGAHTVGLKHGGTTGQAMFVDAVLVPLAAPVPIFLKQDYPFQSGGSSPAYTSAQVTLMNNNRAAVDTINAAIVAANSNVTFVPYVSANAPSGLPNTVDGIHPNDRWMKYIADEYNTALITWALTHDPDALYATV